MSPLLVVPIHLDALYLPQSQYVTEPMVDFTQVPYFAPVLGRDINPETPYLSEAIVSQPFQDQSLKLKAGIHLHWSLPDALTNAQHKDDVTVFPTVPNRWLVTRSRQIDRVFVVDRQWVVESDFLSEDNPGSISYPYIADQMEAGSYPFRYLGRRIPLESWQATTSSENYLTQLTAVGYGEPTFAAFYPNCHSVFGFYDGGGGTDAPSNLRYDVVGWYGDIDQDVLAIALQSLDPNTSWQATVEDAFSWTASDGDRQPERLVCYA